MIKIINQNNDFRVVFTIERATKPSNINLQNNH